MYRYPQKSERALNFLEPELVMVVMGYGCWESNLGILEEQQTFLTAEPFFPDSGSYFCLQILFSVLRTELWAHAKSR